MRGCSTMMPNRCIGRQRVFGNDAYKCASRRHYVKVLGGTMRGFRQGFFSLTNLVYLRIQFVVQEISQLLIQSFWMNFSICLLKLSLEHLRLAGIDLLTDEKISDLSQCLSALVLIDLSLCYNLTESTLFPIAKNCPLLEDISMEGTNLGGGGGDGATDIVKNPRIKCLNFENNRNLSDECLAKLASVCPSLEVLDVSSCNGFTEKRHC
ncbi:hypothetical protein RHSIM_RhsimUnG0244200 [Rhododendron simsii]|uniref:Uncharacterized protein n=1 Tax=Rhododendron simsii TaxID=118357 RepID=A0A834L1Z8_RHOSS|nr:hypothetical protein RHSIM_RhsimUnG0244200 [Rhododendron simsii]